ncbi:unnamed protein product, partial [Polarella glacialis]
SSEHKEKIQLMFELFDADRNGQLSRSELKEVLMKLLDESWTDDKIAALFANFDANKDGQLSLGEFCIWLTQDFQDVAALAEVVNHAPDPLLESRRAFIKKKVGAGFSYKVAVELYDKADRDKDGHVDEEENKDLAD